MTVYVISNYCGPVLVAKDWKSVEDFVNHNDLPKPDQLDRGEWFSEHPTDNAKSIYIYAVRMV